MKIQVIKLYLLLTEAVNRWLRLTKFNDKSYLKTKIPYRSITLTFDDGYASNLSNVKPLLEQFDIPATSFLIT